MSKRQILEVSHLSKNYKNYKVLDDLNFCLNSGEGLGIIGLNGVGKTTLLECILGLKKSKNTNLKLFDKFCIKNGKIDSKLKVIRKDIGYVPEEQNFYNFLTVFEFLSFISKFTVFDEEESLSSINYLIEYFDLKKYENKTFNLLSKGTKQKILICSSLLIKPKLLLLDEPMVHLDPIIRVKVTELLNEYKSKGISKLNIPEPGSFILVSHDLNNLFELCDRIIVISNKKIIFDDKLELVKSSFNIKDYIDIT